MGLATSQLLASRSASISLADLQEAARKIAVEALLGSTTKHLATVVDVRDGASVDSWIDKTVQKFGKLDGAVNMAGVLFPSVPLTEVSNDQLGFVLSVNVVGVFKCLRAQLKAMTAGSIACMAQHKQHSDIPILFKTLLS
ncbi:hypothetical protein QQX98_002746 [Neonectria punicea]|uniref:Uncharacterized protein n=1 Tax=Neonectria punicea TaxID=979145 RepID=A0ABR1HHU8_9HYPO